VEDKIRNMSTTGNESAITAHEEERKKCGRQRREDEDKDKYQTMSRMTERE
jgi:hypothetical protein